MLSRTALFQIQQRSAHRESMVMAFQPSRVPASPTVIVIGLSSAMTLIVVSWIALLLHSLVPLALLRGVHMAVVSLDRHGIGPQVDTAVLVIEPRLAGRPLGESHLRRPIVHGIEIMCHAAVMGTIRSRMSQLS